MWCACRCSVKFSNYLAGEKGAGCFTLYVLWLCFCRFLAVPWVGLQSVIVVFPGNTHLLLVIPYCMFVNYNYQTNYVYNKDKI